MNPEVKYVTWKEVKTYIEELLEELKKIDLDNCPGIFTFPRGGLVLATILSHQINKPLLMNPQEGCIIIDDILDSGVTLEKYLRENKNYFITTMFVQKNKKGENIFSSFTKNKEWIIYPWENINNWD